MLVKISNEAGFFLVDESNPEVQCLIDGKGVEFIGVIVERELGKEFIGIQRGHPWRTVCAPVEHLEILGFNLSTP